MWLSEITFAENWKLFYVCNRSEGDKKLEITKFVVTNFKITNFEISRVKKIWENAKVWNYNVRIYKIWKNKVRSNFRNNLNLNQLGQTLCLDDYFLLKTFKFWALSFVISSKGQSNSIKSRFLKLWLRPVKKQRCKDVSLFLLILLLLLSHFCCLSFRWW